MIATRPRHGLPTLAAALAWALASMNGAQVDGKQLALLVGCTNYPLLPANLSLQGPANDVDLARQLLIDRFAFSQQDIVELVHANPVEGRPTRANIERELVRLIDVVESGDTVFILLAGHGSQQPDFDDDDDEEWDRMDEVFLPEDVPAWRDKGPTDKAISDDQLHEWLSALRAQGADVVFVADMCHAGSMDRGPADEGGFAVTRRINPEVLYGPDAAEQIAALPGNPPAQGPMETDNLPGALVRIYAVPPDRLEKEHPMPPNEGRFDKRYGRLSYALHKILSNSHTALTYRELAQQLSWQYQQWDWYPSCYIRGGGAVLDRFVLGKAEVRERSEIVVTWTLENALVINAGALHGMARGAKFAVRPLGVDGDAAAAYVEVVQVGASTSEVVPCEFNGAPAAKRLDVPSPGNCQLVEAGAPDLTLTVRAVPQSEEAPTAESVTDVATLLEDLARESNSLITLADAEELPEMFVLVGPDDVRLGRAFDAKAAGTGAPPTFGPYRRGPDLKRELRVALQRVAKATNIRAIASGSLDEERFRGPIGAPEVNVRLEKKQAGAEEFVPFNPLAEGAAVRDRDRIRVTVENVGRVSFDVTILYIESGYRVISYFPTLRQVVSDGFDNRVSSGQSVSATIPINDRTVGLEHVVVIATEAHDAMRQQFAFLQQDGLPAAASRGAASRGVASPLARLLDSAAYGSTLRGRRTPAELASYSVRSLSWTVVGREQTAE